MQRFEAHGSELALAAPVWHELIYGVGRLPEGRRKLNFAGRLAEMERILPILPYDTQAASWHASERVRLAAEQKTAPFADGQIAAVARVNGLVLVTRNVKDFRWFSELVVENWFETPG